MKDGILLINKPSGMTSRDVVNIISKRLNTRHVGHSGTLDPMATGLLIVCVNCACKLIDLLTCDDKEYIASVKVGIETDTLDITGKTISESSINNLDRLQLEKTLSSYVGSYMQEVPYYSAVKVNGKRLYDYARHGEMVNLPKRMVTIKDISLIECLGNTFSFKVHVSKGTYIRSLIRDIGHSMNTLMTMSALVRTKVNGYSLDEAINPEDVMYDSLINMSDFLSFPKIIPTPDLQKKVCNGVKIANTYGYEYVMFVNNVNELLAIYKNNEKNELCAYKVF